jgi:2-keto-3-deoxy-L-rhamnonate aldolase RhmA
MSPSVLDMGAEAVLIPASTPPTRRARRWPRLIRCADAVARPRAVRASNYGMAPDYVATCAKNLLIACQIESAAAVGNIDEILAVDSVDMLLIGPTDLSATVGQMGNISTPRSRG